MGVKSSILRLGTRGSPLALAQTAMVRAALAAARPDVQTEIVVIRTSGDWTPAMGETRLEESAGGKAQFAKEIEEALLAGRVDAGIYSMKDMDSTLPAGLKIDHMLPREDARDAFIFNGLPKNIQNIDQIPNNTVIGTCSVRRQAFLMHRRPDLRIVPLRGNVQTRLGKLRRGEQGMGGIMLAMAGLKRLGLEGQADLAIAVDEMVPCAGQGAVGVEIRENDEKISAIFSHINCLETVICVKAERAVLEKLGGSCHTPVGVHARLALGQLNLRICLAGERGTARFSEEGTRAVAHEKDAINFGHELAKKLIDKVPPAILSSILPQRGPGKI